MLLLSCPCCAASFPRCCVLRPSPYSAVVVDPHTYLSCIASRPQVFYYLLHERGACCFVGRQGTEGLYGAVQVLGLVTQPSLVVLCAS